MSPPVVFLGPSLPRERARHWLRADYREPARCGDVLRAVNEGARTIGLIDGYFHDVPSVWHKEVLWALSRGVRVLGAASMGALRAAELDVFGMEGVGRIYRDYRTARLTDDDEVAIRHGPAELGFPHLSEALVNIRATLARAVRQGVVEAEAAALLVATAKATFYPKRSWPCLLDQAAKAGIAVDRLSAWLPAGRVDVKAIDATLLLRAVARGTARAEPPPASFEFAHTEMWQMLCERVGGASGMSVGK